MNAAFTPLDRPYCDRDSALHCSCVWHQVMDRIQYGASPGLSARFSVVADRGVLVHIRRMPGGDRMDEMMFIGRKPSVDKRLVRDVARKIVNSASLSNDILTRHQPHQRPIQGQRPVCKNPLRQLDPNLPQCLRRPKDVPTKIYAVILAML